MRDIYFLGKGVTVRASGDPENTIINAQDEDRVMIFESHGGYPGETDNTIIVPRRSHTFSTSSLYI